MPILIILALINYKNVFIGRYLNLAIKLTIFYLLIALLQIYILLINNTIDLEEKSFRILISTISYTITSIHIISIVSLANLSGFNFKDAMKAIKISSFILIIYMTIELLSGTYDITPFNDFINIVTPFIQYRSDLEDVSGRIRGFSNEPSYLGVVIVFLISTLLVFSNNKLKDYIFIFIILFLSSFSMSKNILIGAIFILVINFFYFKKILVPTILLIIYLCYKFYIMTSSLDAYMAQYQNLGYDISTITRVGSWVAAWNGFLDSPIFGNGFGIAGKYLQYYYPQWFFNSPEASGWLAASENYGAPVFNSLFRVLFEGGIAGLVCLIYFIISLIRLSNNRSILTKDNAILLAGFSMAFMMVDQLSYWPFYVVLGLCRSNNIIQRSVS
jgi:hypothetical protein